MAVRWRRQPHIIDYDPRQLLTNRSRRPKLLRYIHTMLLFYKRSVQQIREKSVGVVAPRLRSHPTTSAQALRGASSDKARSHAVVDLFGKHWQADEDEYDDEVGYIAFSSLFAVFF